MVLALFHKNTIIFYHLVRLSVYIGLIELYRTGHSKDVIQTCMELLVIVKMLYFYIQLHLLLFFTEVIDITGRKYQL